MYGRGLRRRLPSMLGGDQRRIRLVYSLMFSLPGTPVLFYGEEIGMAENLDDRGALRGARADAVVAASATAGSRRADEPVPAARSPTARSASARSTSRRQRREPGSLLNWMERLIRRRRECPELGWGDVVAARAGRRGGLRAPRRLGRIRRSSPCTTSAAARPRRGSRSTRDGVLVDLFGARRAALDGELALALEPYGHRWFRLRRPGQRIAP